MNLRDLDGDLINHWYIIALSHEVKPGRVVARDIYDKPYAISRGKNGIVSVILDRCLHRGAKLSEGKCFENNLMCPYHGWTYNQQGTVVEVPSEGPLSDKLKTQNQKRNWQQQTLPVYEQDGCIWVWPGEVFPQPEKPPWRFPWFGNSYWSQYFMITEFDNEVTALVQNFMDVPHTVFVHSTWFRNRKSLKVPIQLEVTSDKVKVSYDQPSDNIGFLVGRLINPLALPMKHTVPLRANCRRSQIVTDSNSVFLMRCLIEGLNVM